MGPFDTRLKVFEALPSIGRHGAYGIDTDSKNNLFFCDFPSDHIGRVSCLHGQSHRPPRSDCSPLDLDHVRPIFRHPTRRGRVRLASNVQYAGDQLAGTSVARRLKGGGRQSEVVAATDPKPRRSHGDNHVRESMKFTT